MNTSGEVADLMVKEGLQITEEVVKLTGLGAKNLAAIVIALLKEDNKLQGKTNLKKLLCPPSKNGHRKASKNGMNRSLSFVFERRPHLFHGSLDNEPLPT